jgi:rhamnopyranosyl-N-acetylglucosaminyl-diphospho-decaprenol beta-1,3/1,4-galactofuranosyltransferase
VNPVPEKIAIAVVTFNRSAFLQELLASVTAMNTAPWRIVVVDNASTDDTQAVIADAMADFPDGMLINHRLDTNTGGSGGFSEGTKVALELGADWVWLMDDDVEILPEALDRFAPWMARFKCLHGRRYDYDGSPFYWQAKFNNFLAVPLPYTRKTFNKEGFAITNSGTFEGMLIHADVVRLIGLPDPRFFISWDDAVYAWLAAQVTDVAYVDAYVLKRKREQKQISLAGVRHFNDSSALARYHVMRNRAYVAKYFAAHGKLNRVGFAIGTALTFAKEVFRLIAVEHTLRGAGVLIKGMRDSRKLQADTTWLPMDPKDVPA